MTASRRASVRLKSLHVKPEEPQVTGHGEPTVAGAHDAKDGMGFGHRHLLALQTV